MNIKLEKYYYYSVTILLTLCLVYTRDNYDNRSRPEPKKEDMLLTALSTNKAWRCIQTLPYSIEMLKTDFVICYKHPADDPTISASFHINGYADIGKGKGVSHRYEEHIINVWLTLLQNYPQSTVLDIGSNIGTYTLVSSKMGNPVISVDPSPENHALLFNSLVLNNISEVTQVMNPISDGNYEYTGEMKYGTIGDMLSINGDVYNGILTSITLFDLFDLKPEEDTFIIKIDVEGFECKALVDFLKLERKPKYVPYIQMEVTHFCLSSGWKKSSCSDTFQTEFLPSLEKSGYTPHVPWPITYEELVSTCYFDALFVHKDAKPFPYNNPYLAKSFKDNSHLL